MVSGRLESSGRNGEVALGGGFVVRNRNGTSVTVDHPVINLSSGYVTATVMGKSETVLRLGALEPVPMATSNSVERSGPASFFSAFVFELNDELHTAAFTADTSTWSVTVELEVN
jgi:hypothetical protein